VKPKKLGLERIVFFSDAVFAIAITLLALNLKLPGNNNLTTTPLSHSLLAIIPEFESYVFSFLVVGFYWMSHHYYFRYINRYDYLFVCLNIGFLMCIAFLPFSTSILHSYDEQRLAVIFYAGSMALVGLMKAILWCYASNRRRLILQSLPPSLVLSLTRRTLVPPLIFLISMAVAYFNPFFAELSWILIPVCFLGLKLVRA
jgi:uncharacterized membrane protein